MLGQDRWIKRAYWAGVALGLLSVWAWNLGHEEEWVILGALSLGLLAFSAVRQEIQLRNLERSVDAFIETEGGRRKRAMKMDMDNKANSVDDGGHVVRSSKILPVAVVSVALAIGLLGCATQFDEAAFEEGKKKGWTKEQQLVGYYHGLRLLFARQDDQGLWRVDYASLRNKDVLATVNGMYSDLNKILSSLRFLRFVRQLGMEDALLREEAILRYIRERLAFQELYVKFFELVGEAPPDAGGRPGAGSRPDGDENEAEGEADGNRCPPYGYRCAPPSTLEPASEERIRVVGGGPSRDGDGDGAPEKGVPGLQGRRVGAGFDLLVLWPTTDLTQFEFVPTYIREAQERGWLHKFADLFLFDAEEDTRRLAEAVQGQTPSQKLEEDRRVREGFLLRGWKVIDPAVPDSNQRADMIEVYRAFRVELQDGSVLFQREPRPFMVGYRGLKSKIVNVWVIDVDKPNEPGYGLPNEVVTHTNVKVPRDLVVNPREYAFLVKYARYEKPAERRELPEEPEIYLEIVRAGGVKVDPWERAEDPEGFTVPFRYKEYDERGRLKFSLARAFDPETSKVEWVAKIFPRSVVERYRLKPEFSERRYISATVVGQTLTLQPEDGLEMKAYVDYFIEEKPYEIEYELNGRRVILRDEDGDGKFEKRRVMAK